MVAIDTQYLGGYNRSGRTIACVNALVIHRSLPYSTAKSIDERLRFMNERRYNTERQLIRYAPHYVINETTIVQTLPETEAGYHVGTAFYNYTPLARQLMGNEKSANNVTIGVELCTVEGPIPQKVLQNALPLVQHLIHQYHLQRHQIVRPFELVKQIHPDLIMDALQWKAFLDAVYLPERVY